MCIISPIHVSNRVLPLDFPFVIFFPCQYFKICIVCLKIFIFYHITFLMNKLHFVALTLFPFKRQESKFSEWRVSICTRCTFLSSFKRELNIDRVYLLRFECASSVVNNWQNLIGLQCLNEVMFHKSQTNRRVTLYSSDEKHREPVMLNIT